MYKWSFRRTYKLFQFCERKVTWLLINCVDSEYQSRNSAMASSIIEISFVATNSF